MILNRASAHPIVGASTIAIRPLHDFQAKIELGGRLFDMGGSMVNYGMHYIGFTPIN